MIPATVVDNFFQYPDKIRNLALNTPITTSQDNYPGGRTDCLHEIDYDLYNLINLNVLSLFYDFTEQPSKMMYKSDLRFQFVDRKYGDGWIHRDNAIITFIIYLNPEADPNTGTSLYTNKNLSYNIGKDVEEKEKAFAKDDPQSADLFKMEHSKQFRETFRVSNEYNRLIAFNGRDLHATTTFKDDKTTDPRLTLIGFVNQVSMPSSPGFRRREYEL